MVDIRFRYKVALSCIIIMMVFVTLSGFSYAYFAAEVTGEGKSFTVTTEGVKLTLNEGDNNINLVDTKPILDSVGVTGTPHTFSITNGNTYPVIAKIYLSVDNASDLDASNIKYAYVKDNGAFGESGTFLTNIEENTSIDTEKYKNSYLLDTINLSATGTEGAIKDGFKILLWIDKDVGSIQSCDIDDNGTKTCETSSDPTMGKTFKAYITIKTEPNKAAAVQSSNISSNQGVNEGPQIFDNPSEISENEGEESSSEVTIPEVVFPEITGPETVNPEENGEVVEEPSIG